jgi:ubiquinone/menaquinone biosynthesis C-methylase UbiE
MKADFDQAAQNYDNYFTFSEIGKIQRNLVYQKLQKQLINIKKIIEINCGTGEDAIWLAQQGFQVTATDISEIMIEIAQSKSNVNHLTFKVLDINHLSEETENFDLLFSNFGGLNCLTKKELALFFNSAAKILKEKGKMSLVIMPKNTLWEQFYFVLKLDFKAAFRRKKEVAFANVDGEKVATYYYNPKDIVTLSEINFEFLEVKPIGFFIPPSYLEPFFKNKKPVLNGLTFLENKIKNRSFLSKYADHYIITLQKR